MLFAAAPLADVPYASLRQPDNAIDDEALHPIVVSLNGVQIASNVLIHTLQIDDTLGQPVVARLTFVNLSVVVGDIVTVTYFSLVIFSGTINHAEKRSPDLTTFFYACDCLDWSQILVRRRLSRNFINATVQSFISSLIQNELNGEGITIGTIDARAVFPLIDSRNAKMFDVVRTVAGGTGMTFYMGFDKTIQMRSTTVSVAPLVLDESHVQVNGSSIMTDRETYRNTQTAIVTGTPQVQGQAALTASATRRNNDQIAARQSKEGGTGIYEEIESITHPTSNDPIQLVLLAVAYANLRLAVSGSPRLTFSCQAYGYGLRAGQVATVSLPTFGIVGTFYIQKVSIQEVAARYLNHTIELTSSSLQQRSYESWLAIVGAGKVTVQIPSSLTNNLASFITPGTTTWTVPNGVTSAEFTCYGASGGGGGGVRNITNPPFCLEGTPHRGGNGGRSGKSITTMLVVAGNVFDIHIGASGVAGVTGISANPVCATPVTAVSGAVGASTSISISGVVVCQADASGGGIKATFSTDGIDGFDSGGIGDAVSVGGGKAGGNRGTGSPFVQPSQGQDGLLEIRY